MRERLARKGFRLGDFVFMMRKDQVFSSGMQVEALSEFPHRHDGAFQVPARTPGSNRRIPRSFSWLGRLPEGEVARAVFVIFVDINAGAVQHVAEVFFRELAVLRKL